MPRDRKRQDNRDKKRSGRLEMLKAKIQKRKWLAIILVVVGLIIVWLKFFR